MMVVNREEVLMSHEQTKSLFAVMRAAANGQITPEVAEDVSEKVCHPGKLKINRARGDVRIRFTGNRLTHTTPEERD
jgi:hypothetical protein